MHACAREQTLYGRRRLDWFSRHENGFAQELRKNALVKQAANTRFACTGGTSLELKGNGDALLGGARGRWGAMNDPTIGSSCPVDHCLFVDVRGQLHNAHFEQARVRLFPNHYRTSPAAAGQPLYDCAAE